MLYTLILLLPLLGATVTGLTCSKISHRAAQLITCGSLTLAAALAWKAFFDVLGGTEIVIPLSRWIEAGTLHVGWALKLDRLSASMMILVTTVSACVHIYSVGYMSHDKHVPRFMSYLSLFTFCMLVLVTADNFLQLFVGWEGVGLCSYLLIGFWFHKESANKAALKAFLVNRVADAFFVLGICAVFVQFGSLNFADVLPKAASMHDAMFTFGGHSFGAMNLIAALLFIGAMGKSAQLFLHTWLPDAMEGPTPVSALIHAATMVTAGVFLVVRCSYIFEQAPLVLNFIAVIGGATALFAASVAMTQNDVKRVIAYSTCSQLGYMFFACGVSAYSAAMFHLVTHGFFKALLFLCAGNVIHGFHDEQDMRNMGGARKKLPVTHALFVIGSLALVGIFPFAGYYSKDLILEAAFASGGPGKAVFFVGLFSALLTAFYSARVLTLVFYGKCRASHEVEHHLHEAPAVMLAPLALLSVGAVASGAAGKYLLHVDHPEHVFWNGAISLQGRAVHALEAAHHSPVLVQFAPLIVGVVGLGAGYLCYSTMKDVPARVSAAVGPLYQFLYRKWLFDELYDKAFVEPVQKAADYTALLDKEGVDQAIPGAAACGAEGGSRYISLFQSGLLHDYAMWMLAGLACCLFIVNL